jgi:trehalose synthase-fused probable maltokinase
VTVHAIRLHGDYHLGQVLVTRNDFVITDFEGEPARPIEERRRKHVVLKDVAAMLRSFDYARTVARRNAAAKPRTGPSDHAALLADWRAQTHEAFLSAYRGAVRDTELLPPEAADIGRLLSLARIERVLYEIRYELAHRPAEVIGPLEDLIARV